MEEIRICKVCGEPKDISNFYNGKKEKGKTLKTCRSCRNEIVRNFRQENNDIQRAYDKKRYQAQKEHRVKYAREYRKKYPERTRATNWKVKYGITPEEFYKKLAEQNNCCAICHRDMKEYGKIFSVDHNHLTEEIRGLLCDPCNYGLGFYEKYKDEYIKYLSKFND